MAFDPKAPTGAAKEVSMAKEQKTGAKESKKPKSDKPKGEASAYKKSLGKSGQPISVPGKKG